MTSESGSTGGSGESPETRPGIVRLGIGDVHDALALSAAAGWNQTAADWIRLTTLEPEGCFAVRDGDRLIGTVTATSYGSELAWIGMMVVHPDFRRRGLGAALMRAALGHLRAQGVATVKLDATPAGRPLYESLGFVPETEVERWEGVSRGALQVSDTAPPEPITSVEDSMLELDRTAYGADRSRLLARLVAESDDDSLILGSGIGPEGFALARQGRSARYIGPIISGSSRVTLRLLDAMLDRFAGERVCLDLYRGGRLDPADLEQRGLLLGRGLTRMRLGPRPEFFGSSMPQMISSSAGPEFG